jgi:flagellar basal body-associated protein FliL
MEERIDFVLEPGVIIFAILFLVGINLLLAAVIYPYFRGSSDAEETEETEAAPEPEEDFESVSASADDEAFEQRVDEFLEDVRSEKVE